MWHALRTELAYFRSFLLGGLGIAMIVSVIISIVFSLADKSPPSHVTGFLRGIFFMLAPMVVSFIIQALRHEERRTLLLLAGPLTPRQLAGVTVLLPVVLLGIGGLASGLVIGAGVLVTGEFQLRTLQIAGSSGGVLFIYAQLGLLVQEAVAASRQGRRRPAAAGWASIAAAVLFLAVVFLMQSLQVLTWKHVILGQMIVVLSTMGATVTLYAGRNDFTR